MALDLSNKADLELGLLAHTGHKIVIASYGDNNSVCLECETCGETLLDSEDFDEVPGYEGQSEWNEDLYGEKDTEFPYVLYQRPDDGGDDWEIVHDKTYTLESDAHAAAKELSARSSGWVFAVSTTDPEAPLSEINYRGGGAC